MDDSGYDDISVGASAAGPNRQDVNGSVLASWAGLRGVLSLIHTNWRLSVHCFGAVLVGVVAWSDEQTLVPTALLLFLPLLICRADSRPGAFLVACFYYGTATRSVPGIIDGFFPSLPLGTNLLMWATHTVILSLPWVATVQSHRSMPFRRALGVLAALVLLTVPPLGLFHWGSPLMVAGLLFPGWKGWGVIATLVLFGLMVACGRRTFAVHSGIIVLVLLTLVANLTFHTPSSPKGWQPLSLQFGKSPELWSDEMAARRRHLTVVAMQALEQGNTLVVLPESISGSSRRPQTALWQDVVNMAKSRGATVLVGQEVWNKERTGFRNALVGYGVYGDAGGVVISSQVPMPIGDWKFGYEGGAETNIWGSDVIALYGRRVAVSLCYEDFLLWPHRGLLAGKAELLISATNQWPSSGTSAEIAQDVSRMALARLAGVPLLTAKNR